MRRLAVLAAITLAAPSLCAATGRAFQARTPGDPARQSGFQAIAPLVEEAIREGKCPGAVVLVSHKGEVIYRRAFGHRALVPEKLPMEVNTIFDMASLTKVIATTTARWPKRSEEHTSELQSHSDLVCRLLLEKKKTKNTWST